MKVFASDRQSRTRWSFIDLSVLLVTIAVAVLFVGAITGAPAFARLRAIDSSGARGGLLAVSALSAPVTDSTAGNSDNLRLVIGGIPQSYANGSETTISGNLRGRIAVSAPDGTRNRRSIDVFVYTGNGDPRPVPNLAIQATARMPGMAEGSFLQVAVASGDGHYLLPMQFSMAGPWQIDLNFVASGQSASTVRLDLDVWQ